MLASTQLIGFGAQESRVLVVPSYFNFDAVNGTAYTWTDAPIGPERGDRIVVAGFIKSGLQNSATVAAQSIGGSSGTIQIQAHNGGTYAAAIISRLVPTGTTATISITWSGSGAGRSALFVASLYGAKDETLAGGRTASVLNTNPPAMALDSPDRGGAVSILHWAFATASGTADFGALTKYDQQAQESAEFAAAYGERFLAEPTLAAGATLNGTSGALGNLIGLSAAWTPL